MMDVNNPEPKVEVTVNDAPTKQSLWSEIRLFLWEHRYWLLLPFIAMLLMAILMSILNQTGPATMMYDIRGR